MDQLQQGHLGSGDNVGRDKIINNYDSSPTIPRSKYLNAFAHYDLANLVGREQQLKAIDEHLKQHQLLLLHGIGGIGKTILAKAYISKAQDQYNHIAYVEIAGSIAESMLIQLGNSPDVGLAVDPRLDSESKFKALIDTLRHIPKLLLVLDNANDADDLRGCKKQLASLNATVLITGRARPQSFAQERNIEDIQALTPEEALRLFKSHYTAALMESDRPLVDRILKKAFHHPKLVEVIAKAAQANTFLNLNKLSEIVSKNHFEDEEINYPIEIDDQTKKISRVLLDLFDIDLSTKNAKSLSEDAKQALRYFAILPSIDIPVQDLAILLQVESTIDRQALVGTLNSLVNTGGWLEALDNQSFSMHGLVQWVLRQRLVPTAINCTRLISGMATTLSYKPTESALGKQPYLRYTTEWLTLFAGDQDEALTNCFDQIATIYRALGDHQQALVYNQKALAIREAVLPPLALSYNNLAETYWALGDHQQALIYNQKALAIREAVLPPTHPDLASSYNNLGETYGALGDRQQRLAYHQKALAIWEAVLPPTHPDLALSYNNLGETYGALGDHQQRLVYNQKALAIWEAVLPPTHPDLASSYSNLGSTYGALGDHQQRLVYNQKALAIRESVLPPTHPDLALSYSNLGSTYGALGDHQQRLVYNQKALAIREAVLPPTHPDLALSYNNLGSTYWALGDHQQALACHQKALAIREAVLPPTHPDLASSYSNLGSTYRALGDHQQALACHQKALAIRESVLPPTHPVNPITT